MKTSPRVPALTWTIGVAVSLASCAQPKLSIRVEPTGTSVYVDGELTSPGREQTSTTSPIDAPKYERASKYIEPFDHEMSLSYYGTTRLSARRPATAAKGEKNDVFTVDWMDRHQGVTVDEPFSPWLFPFDFVLECLTYPFVSSDGRYTHRTKIELQKRPEVPRGIAPRDLAAIRARARRAREER